MKNDVWREDIPLSTSPWKLLLFVTQPYKVVAISACVFAILANSMGIATAYVFKLITNAAQALATGGTMTPLWHATFLYIAISLLTVLFYRISGLTGMYWSSGVGATTRHALSSYVMQHSHSYFTDRFAGSLSHKLEQASSNMRSLAYMIIWEIIHFFVSIIGSLILAFYTHPLIAFIFLIWVCVVAPINIYLVRKNMPLVLAAQKAGTVVNGATVDMLTNMSAVHEYARQPFELSRLKELILKRLTAGLANWKTHEHVRLVNGILHVLFTGGMMVSVAYLTMKGILSAGDIILVLTIVLLIKDRIESIGSFLYQLSEAYGQVVESLTDIVRPYDITDKADARVLAHARGEISLKDISFLYSDGGVQVFENLSIEIPAGQRVGLVGRSGAGKSTLMKLLLRHTEPTKGIIAIDGNDISEIKRDSLREAIAVVPQEPLLFHRTIRENIAYGKLDARQEEIEHIAQMAEAHTFITQLPEKYESLVGERGVKLSGGQRQRIAIARAMIKDAPILLLDEATSSLDSESEVAVQKALLALMKGRTVIAIAHRLSTLRAMDRIIVMDAGHIVEDGTHDTLLKKEGLYATLWNHQAGGFLE